MVNVLYGYGYWGKIVEKSYTLDGPLLIHDPEKNREVNDLDSRLKSPDFRAYLAVPPSCHRELLTSIFDENPEARVLVEKPVMLNDPGFTWELAMEGKFDVIAGHTFLHEEGFKQMTRSLPRDGRDIYITGQRFNPAGPYRTHMSNLEDYGIHDIYLFYEVCKRLHGAVHYRQVAEATLIHSTRFSSLFELSYKNVHARFETRAIAEEKVRLWKINADDYSYTWDYTTSKNVGKTPLEIQWDILGSNRDDHYYHTLEDAYKCQTILTQLSRQ